MSYSTEGFSSGMQKVMKENYVASFKKWAINSFLNTSWVDDPTLDWFVDRTCRALDKVRNDQPLIIGLCGNMGCGKDSATDLLINHPAFRCEHIAFADPIRQIGKIFGFSMKQMTDRTLKETNDDFWHFSPRYFMQKVGTEMFRNQLRDDVWIELLKRRLIDLKKPYEVEIGFPKSVMGTRRIIFITDVRFPNEAKAIRDIGGTIVKISREGFNKKGDDLHPSERFISQIPADYTIENKAASADEWAWYFTKFLTIFFKKDAYYELGNIGK